MKLALTTLFAAFLLLSCGQEVKEQGSETKGFYYYCNISGFADNGYEYPLSVEAFGVNQSHAYAGALSECRNMGYHSCRATYNNGRNACKTW